MNHLFWLEPNRIAGRSGPNKDPWSLTEIAEAGFKGILSVNNGEAVHKTLIDRLGLAYAHIPLSDNAPPKSGDVSYCLAALPNIITFIEETLERGPVLIHCRSGKDRTGLTMAAYLVRCRGMSATEAMQRVLDVRPIAFSAEGWFEFCEQVLEEFSLGH